MFDQADRDQLAAAGIAEEEAIRQLRVFADPPPPLRLDRPATIGDGIVELDADQRAAARAAFARASAAGRVMKFVPASGAATRMFQDLLAVRAIRPLTRAALERRAPTEAAAREALRFLDHIDCFAFADALAAALRVGGGRGHDGDIAALLAALLDADGLGYASAPKGLVLFHRYPDGPRTAFEEHLVEAAALAAGGRMPMRLHCTVALEHEARFQIALERARARHGGAVAVELSHQSPSTDTLAADLENRPFRTAEGRLLLRPGGHGALLDNLDRVRGDVIFIKNIDNIPPDHLREPAADCARLLLGHLICVQDELFAHRVALERDGGAAVQAACRFAAAVLHQSVPADGAAPAALRALLDRPLRVCGMVRNTGEPGGGPFWVRAADGRQTLQIVESAQVAAAADQQAIFAAATHFNPVVMACGVRDRRGEPFDLQAFVDPAAVFIARKSKDGRPLQALERPGLWNGGMAEWNTIFVEVPDVTFTPVKTVNDLLRPAHQPAAEYRTARTAGDG